MVVYQFCQLECVELSVCSICRLNVCFYSLPLYIDIVGYFKQGPHSFSFFELKNFLKTFFTTLTTYCKKFAIFLRKLKIH